MSGGQIKIDEILQLIYTQQNNKDNYLRTIHIYTS